MKSTQATHLTKTGHAPSNVAVAQPVAWITSPFSKAEPYILVPKAIPGGRWAEKNGAFNSRQACVTACLEAMSTHLGPTWREQILANTLSRPYLAEFLRPIIGEILTASLQPTCA